MVGEILSILLIATPSMESERGGENNMIVLATTREQGQKTSRWNSIIKTSTSIWNP